MDQLENASRDPSKPARTPDAGPAETLDRHWQQVLPRLILRDAVVANLVSVARPHSLADGKLTIRFPSEFRRCKEALDQDERRHAVEEAASAVFGTPILLNCVLSETYELPAVTAPKPTQPPTAVSGAPPPWMTPAIREAMGRAEVASKSVPGQVSGPDDAQPGHHESAIPPTAEFPSPPPTDVPPEKPATVCPTWICQACGIEAPTRQVAFHQNIGALVIRFDKLVEGELCKSCIHCHFWSSTLVTATIGWWSPLSIVLTPVFILNNVVQYLFSLRLPPAPFGATAPSLTGDAVRRLEPYEREILHRVNGNENIKRIAQDIALRVGVTPGQVGHYFLMLVKTGNPSQPDHRD